MGIIQRSGRWNRCTKQRQQWKKHHLVQRPVLRSFLLENFASFPFISYIQATLNCCFVLMISVTYHCAAKRPEPPEKNQCQQEEEDQQSNSQDGPIWLEEKHREWVSTTNTKLPSPCYLSCASCFQASTCPKGHCHTPFTFQTKCSFPPSSYSQMWHPPFPPPCKEAETSSSLPREL